MLFAVAVHADRGSGSQAAWRLGFGAVFQPDAAIDGGGELSTDRAYAELGRSWRLGERSRAGLTIGFGEERYDFSGDGFSALDPWERIRELRFSANIAHSLGDKWTLFALPSVRLAAERGASLDDGSTFGLLAGATYRFSDKLKIGPGLGAFTEIEDDASFFPILLVDWAITDRLSFETGQGLAASRGPGLQLRWRQSERWEFAVGGRYEKLRFRLDDDGVAPGGVGEDRSLPLYAVARYQASDNILVSFLAGAKTSTELSLEDDGGNPIREVDADTAGFVGLTLRMGL
jgi:outer membrane receptor protein involved in Fe transport